MNLLHLSWAASLLFLLGCSGGGPEGVDPTEGPIGACVNRIEYRIGGDVHLDAAYHYDEAGRVLQYVETNRLGDRVFVVTRTYDQRGRRVGQEVENHRFETGPERSMTWEWDDDDRVVRTTYVGWGQGGAMRESLFFYDAEGRRSRVETYEDGAKNSVSRYTWMDGEPLLLEIENAYGPDGTPTTLHRYTFAEGRWLTRLETSSSSSETLPTEVYTYEDVSTGRVSRRDFDFEGDGQIDSVSRFSRDAAGRVTRAEYDDDGVDPPEQTMDFEYDGGGLLSRRVWHVADQGAPFDLVTEVAWSEGRLARVTRLDGETAAAIESWSFEYGCPDEMPMDVPISPIHGFRYELEPIPFGVDLRGYFGFPEML